MKLFGFVGDELVPEKLIRPRDSLGTPYSPSGPTAGNALIALTQLADAALGVSFNGQHTSPAPSKRGAVRSISGFINSISQIELKVIATWFRCCRRRSSSNADSLLILSRLTDSTSIPSNSCDGATVYIRPFRSAIGM